jgi:hypothetical protein
MERIRSDLNATAFPAVREQMLSSGERRATVVTSDEPRDAMLV